MSTDLLAEERVSAPPPTRAAGWGSLVILLAGTFMSTLDYFIVNVAVPDAQADLHAGAAAIQWVVAAFGLAVAAGLITGGRLGDLYGRRRLFGIGTAVFTAASAACALSGNASELIAARVGQGIGMALLAPQVLGIIAATFTGPRQAKAYAAYGFVMGVAGVFGQLIGGVVIRADLFGLGWRNIFWINVPIGIVAVALLRPMVPESKGDRGTGLDLPGVGLVVAALVSTVLPLIQGRQDGWPLWTFLLLAAAVLLLAVFAAYQRWLSGRGGEPLVDPALFAQPGFSAGLGVALAYQMAMGSFFLYLALYLQQGRGLSALDSGLLFLGLGVAYLATSMAATAVTARLGRQVIAVGAVLQGLGYLVLLLAVHDIGLHGSVLWTLPGTVLAGAGMGLAFVPTPGVVLANVGPQHAAAAAGVLSTAQQVGGALGIAIVGIEFYAGTDLAGGFVASLLPMAGFCLLAAGLVQLLPRRAARA
ncbi:MFS transporter [Nocardia stercoris]|uniref:MFS transporter n=1 Tax=Nocardia stercoris TaxID=2483361 RepID=UPI0018F72F03|nr:MFS transporter [Nocardia stercoris]